MVAVVIGDRTYEVAVPFKLRQLREAAPHIDALNAKARASAKATDEGTGVVALGELLSLTLAAILPGIRKADPSVTLDQLEDEFDPDKWLELKGAFNAIFNRSGMSEGEAPAAVETETAAA